MRNEYDFSNSKKNPYAAKLRKQISIRIDTDTINYFKKLSESVGMPYQVLMNLYLSNCASSKKKLSMSWK